MAGIDTYLHVLFHYRYPPPLTSPSSIHPTHGHMDDLADTTTPCLHAKVQFPLFEIHELDNVVEGGRKETGCA